MEPREFSLRAAATACRSVFTTGEGLHLNNVCPTVITKKMAVFRRIEIAHIEFVERFPSVRKIGTKLKLLALDKL